VLLTFNHAGTGDEKELRTTNDDVLDGKGHGDIIRFQGFKVKSKDKAIAIGRGLFPTLTAQRRRGERGAPGIIDGAPGFLRYPRRGSAAAGEWCKLISRAVRTYSGGTGDEGKR
jgi:hypothetical protein